MDYVQVVMVLGLLLLGAALVIWPMTLMVNAAGEKAAALEAELKRVREEQDALRKATNAELAAEREIDAARGRPDELGVLLRPSPAPAAPAAGRPPIRVS